MKKLFFLICAVMVLSVSAFADASYFTPAPFHIESADGSYYFDFSATPDLYYFIRESYVNNDPRYSVYCITDTSGTPYACTMGYNGNEYEYTGNVSYSFGNYFTKQGGFGNPFLSGYIATPSISVFPSTASDQDIQDAFADYLENPPIPAPGTKSTFALPCGNVAYFQVSAAQTVDFKSTYQILSKFFANSTYGYWSDSGQRFGPAASLPTSSTSFPIASQDPLYWTPDPQSKNLLGLSKTGLASASCIIGQWYAFYNPAYNSNNTDWTTMDITGATVSISGSFSAIKIFPLEQVVDYQNGAFVGGSNDDYQSYFDGNIGEDGSVSFTDQNGVSSVPTAGGQNLLAPNETAQSLIEKVVGILQNLLSEIQSLFTFGYDAIQSLVGIMSSFVSSFSQLYTWLPTEVYSALISAVIIAVVIGIFKVFL